MIDLDKLLELEAKATPGPWDCDESYGQFFINQYSGPTTSDLELMDVMRNFIKELCAELRAARTAISALKVYRFTECRDCEESKSTLDHYIKQYDEVVK